ncbi:8296_t:CDS:2 [Paraglomus occultum]|uniref:8296_t:CDS:1 n=1 Tax=Paraglomus occultum TaxID=144539 RepID=A0A9N9BYZ8_9GLOM|nr:8296_t:CDS:2 [Paraglomus occultum]
MPYILDALLGISPNVIDIILGAAKNFVGNVTLSLALTAPSFTTKFFMVSHIGSDLTLSYNVCTFTVLESRIKLSHAFSSAFSLLTARSKNLDIQSLFQRVPILELDIFGNFRNIINPASALENSFLSPVPKCSSNNTAIKNRNLRYRAQTMVVFVQQATLPDTVEPSRKKAFLI